MADIFKFIFSSNTIYCQPDGPGPRVPATNINEQQVLQQNTQNASQSTSNVNVQRVNQVNQQEGDARPATNNENLGNNPFINWNLFTRYRNSSNTMLELNYKCENDSFWDNISYLRRLRMENFIREDVLIN
uniref:Uncharacterized protein n=1 Tax=Ganoderma leucocontextum TaxID=1566825 RepID=A0A2S1WBH4_9APHY|nr:hypothetical protein [Ganoderma leucocontextum]AWJ63948.1 hypothetical protein [Ganoderma leucocontextum]